MKRVQFYVTDDEYTAIARKAASKGMSEGQLAKTATFDHINQHPPKGVMLQIYESQARERRTDASDGDSGGVA